jgi:hypothetical protein
VITGLAFTVNNVGIELGQPLVLTKEKDAVPADIAVTNPVVEFTVATPVALLVHVPVTSALNVKVLPIHNLNGVGCDNVGGASTVRSVVASERQPSVFVYINVAVP